MFELLKMFHSLGFSDGEVYREKTSTLLFEYANNTLKIKNKGINEGFGIRVLDNKRIGFSNTSKKEKISEAIREAHKLSKFSPQSDFSFPSKQVYKPALAFDSKVFDCDEKQIKEILDLILGGIKKYSTPLRVVLKKEVREIEIANTNQLYGNTVKTSFLIYVEAKNNDGFGTSSYLNFLMPKEFEIIGEEAGKMAKEMSNASSPKPGIYKVIFSPQALSELLEILVQSFSGEWKRRKISKLCNKTGEKVFSEHLTIVDNPFENALGKTYFDGEGVSTKPTVLIENGKVINFLYNREEAALSKVNNEGNCVRSSFSSLPKIGISNLKIKSNSGNPKEELSSYIYVISMHGLHTANFITGDFGAEVNAAFLIENKNIKGIRNFIISDNIFELFNKIELIGKDLYQYGNFIVPDIAFNNIKIIS